tara:strand:- start:929 stop:1432 length:504 start_codon:yes stop_codon:yes gene_type:complete
MLKNFKNGYAVCGNDETAKREKNDCVVRAIANACDINYEQAHAFVKEKFGRKDGQGTLMFNHVLKELKTVQFEQVGQLDLFNPTNERQIKHLGDCPKFGGTLKNPKYKHKPVAYTVKEFARRFNKGNFILQVNKHALAVKDGVIVDNKNYQTDGYRRVVESAFQVTV